MADPLKTIKAKIKKQVNLLEIPASESKRRFKLKILGKNLQVHLNIIRELPRNDSSILRNLDNFPPGAFYSTPLQLGTKQ